MFQHNLTGVFENFKFQTVFCILCVFSTQSRAYLLLFNERLKLCYGPYVYNILSPELALIVILKAGACVTMLKACERNREPQNQYRNNKLQHAPRNPNVWKIARPIDK